MDQIENGAYLIKEAKEKQERGITGKDVAIGAGAAGVGVVGASTGAAALANSLREKNGAKVADGVNSTREMNHAKQITTPYSDEKIKTLKQSVSKGKRAGTIQKILDSTGRYGGGQSILNSFAKKVAK